MKYMLFEYPKIFAMSQADSASVSLETEVKEEAVADRKPMRLPANVGTLNQDEAPFSDYLIDDWKFLEHVDQRSPCSKCKKSRKYFCYTCYVPVVELSGKIPKLKLPIKIDILKHAREIDGKSTAAHAALLAPDDVSIYTYPCIPDYDCSSGKVVLVFPGKKSTSLKDHIDSLIQKNQSQDGTPDAKKQRTSDAVAIERAVFIDSTWNQSRGIYRDARLQGLPCIVLQERVSQFWRHQEGSPRWYLATVEAVHQLLVELETSLDPSSPCH
ncbi:hypothetical protein B566_EDAN018984, partial [Ephemera danica]